MKTGGGEPASPPFPEMAPPPPLPCSSPDCEYQTPAGVPDYATLVQLMTLHTTQAHSAPAPFTRPASKVDKRPRPEARQDMTEHDWRYYVSEWEDYKRATGINGQDVLDELWSCMTADLKRLAFDQGGKETLNTEALMMARIRQLAVSVLHSAVHTVNLHESKQAPEESVKYFAARVRAVAANCALAKECTCGLKVSFLEETVFHVVLAGLRDSEMQERCLSAAIMKTITNITSLVEFCSAEESGRMSNPTVGAMRSSYKKTKSALNQQASLPTSSSRCNFCGGGPHSSAARAAREKECRAFKLVCKSCSKVGHVSTCCYGAVRAAQAAKAPQTARTSRTGKNAALEDLAEDTGTVESFAFYGIHVQNRFQALGSLGDTELPPQLATSRPSGLKRRTGPASSIHPQAPPTVPPAPGSTAGYHCSDKVSCNRYPAVPEAVDSQEEHCTKELQCPGQQLPAPAHQLPDPVIKLPALTPQPAAAPISNQSSLPTELAGLQGDMAVTRGTLPLLHMEFSQGPGGSWNWHEATPLPSPLLKVCLSVHKSSYIHLALPLPRVLPGQGLQPVVKEAVADTGAQMDVMSAATARGLGIDSATLLPVKARVFGASRGAEIHLLGGILLEVRPPGTIPPPGTDVKGDISTVRLFYVASNVSRTYLSQATLKNLGIVDANFPRFQNFPAKARLQTLETKSKAGGLPPCSNTGVVTPGQLACSCPRRQLPPSTPALMPCPGTAENVPKLKQFLLNRYASSTFNVCGHQPLPLLKGSPPLKLHVDPNARPRAVHTPAVVPLHWQAAVKEGLDRDERLGVIERVPLNTPVKWQSRMVVTAKQNGDPRRCIDFQAVNDCSPRQTHHTVTPWHLVTSIPEGVKKTTFDCWHGYHSLELATEEDREATTRLLSS